MLVFFLKMRRLNLRLKFDVLTQVKTISDVIRIPKDLRLSSVSFRLYPVLLKFVRPAIRVLHALDIATCARISVPVPSSTDAVTFLQTLDHKSLFSQSMQHVHTGKSCPDYQYI